MLRLDPHLKTPTQARKGPCPLPTQHEDLPSSNPGGQERTSSLLSGGMVARLRGSPGVARAREEGTEVTPLGTTRPCGDRKRTAVPGRGEAPRLEHLMYAGLSGLPSLSQEDSEHLEDLNTWWWRPALRIWESRCSGHEKGMIRVLCLVADCCVSGGC